MPYLKRLRYLSLSYNQITHVPPNMAHMKHLKMLDLSGNKLACLPMQFKDLKASWTTVTAQHATLARCRRCT
ncbi:MAG: leucine-rich repeat domain-containing protein [Holosporaceae bacterium]